MKKDDKAYDFAKKNKARMTASLRALVALYLGYMAWNLIKTANDLGNSMPVWGSWLIALVFAGVAAAFGLFAWRCYQKDLAAAELTGEELAELEPPEDTEADGEDRE